MALTQITLAGIGGQGSIMAGVILGSAAVTYDKKYATQTQAYSSELRGGFAATWVIISDEPVVFPRVVTPDVLLAQAQDSIFRFAKTLKPGGTLIVDSDMVREIPEGIERVHRIPATTIARNELGLAITANMAMLGALCKVTGVVSREALEKAITASVPKGKDAINLKAFDMGFQRVTAD